MFYATFPAARDAVYNAALEQSLYDPPTDCPTSYESAQPLGYNIRNELESFGGPIRELSTHTQLNFDYSNGPHPQQPFLSHQGQSSYYSPSHPVSFFLTFFCLSNFQQRFARTKTRPLHIFRLTNLIIMGIHLNQRPSTSLTPTPTHSRLENRHSEFTNRQIYLHKLTRTSRRLSTMAVPKARGMISVNSTAI